MLTGDELTLAAWTVALLAAPVAVTVVGARWLTRALSTWVEARDRRARDEADPIDPAEWMRTGPDTWEAQP